MASIQQTCQCCHDHWQNIFRNKYKLHQAVHWRLKHEMLLKNIRGTSWSILSKTLRGPIAGNTVSSASPTFCSLLNASYATRSHSCCTQGLCYRTNELHLSYPAIYRPYIQRPVIMPCPKQSVSLSSIQAMPLEIHHYPNTPSLVLQLPLSQIPSPPLPSHPLPPNLPAPQSSPFFKPPPTQSSPPPQYRQASYASFPSSHPIPSHPIPFPCQVLPSQFLPQVPSLPFPSHFLPPKSPPSSQVQASNLCKFPSFSLPSHLLPFPFPKSAPPNPPFLPSTSKQFMQVSQLSPPIPLPSPPLPPPPSTSPKAAAIYASSPRRRVGLDGT